VEETIDGNFFYYALRFDDRKVSLDTAVTDVFDSRRALVTGPSIADLAHGLEVMARPLSRDLGRVSMWPWISLLWLGGKLSPNQSSQRRLAAIVLS